VPASLPGDFDNEAATRLYEYRFTELESSDYPALFWLGRLFAQGQRRIFDLGGHVGVSYYAYQQYLDFPADLRWQVHDTPSVMEKGRELAGKRDSLKRLEFVELQVADGCDVLMAKGSLQYLDYSLADLIRRMQVPPRHLLINLTPMHSSQSFFTLQHIGIAVCPYRVSAVPAFLFEIRELGYRLNVRWDHPERTLRVPFHPGYSIDRYHGFLFSRD
ncbi:MAG TPA: methyltransferase, TIGR04325 family, partial [Dokdonella sp.]|uniref:methyltransferase, TIGR04325 family n=1 Tax=Dokdonella sp. TaxID=2291710 RepID=UPI002D7FB95C